MSYSLQPDGKLEHHQTIETTGNTLDVAVTDGLEIIISVDTAHEAASVVSYANDGEATSTRRLLEAFELTASSNGNAVETEKGSMVWLPSQLTGKLEGAVGQINDLPEIPQSPKLGRPSQRKGNYSLLGEFLYGLENLRKKRGAAAAEGEADDESLLAEEVPEEARL